MNAKKKRGNRKPLNTQQLEELKILRELWDARSKAMGLTQEKAAELLGWSGQSAIAAYLNQQTPLNTDAIFKFAKLLDFDPRKIRPSIPATFLRDKEEESLLDTYRDISPEDKIIILSLLSSLTKHADRNCENNKK